MIKEPTFSDAKKEYRYGYAQEYEMRAELPNGLWTGWYPTICLSDCFREWSLKIADAANRAWLATE